MADQLFMTQRYFDIVKTAYADFCQNDAGRWLMASEVEHKTARALSKIFNLTVEIISTEDPKMNLLLLSPEMAINVEAPLINVEDDDT